MRAGLRLHTFCGALADMIRGAIGEHEPSGVRFTPEPMGDYPHGTWTNADGAALTCTDDEGNVYLVTVAALPREEKQ
jgi:hypothetical protein